MERHQKYRLSCKVRYGIRVRLSKTNLGTLCEKIRKTIKGPVLKAFRHFIYIVFGVVFSRTTSPYLSPAYKVMVSLPSTLYRHYIVKLK